MPKPIYQTQTERITEDEAMALTHTDLTFMQTEIAKATSPNDASKYKELSPWERNFMHGIESYFQKCWELSVKQRQVLAKIYSREIGITDADYKATKTPPKREGEGGIKSLFDDPADMDDDIPF